MTGRNSAAGDPSFRNRMKQLASLLRRAIQKNETYVPFRPLENDDGKQKDDEVHSTQQ